MPLYDFKCNKCGIKEEKLVDRSVKEITCTCGENMERMFPTGQRFTLGWLPYVPRPAGISNAEILDA